MRVKEMIDYGDEIVSSLEISGVIVPDIMKKIMELVYIDVLIYTRDNVKILCKGEHILHVEDVLTDIFEELDISQYDVYIDSCLCIFEQD